MANSFPQQDAPRVAALHRLNLLDAPAEEGFDRLTRLAVTILGVPAAFISLVDEGRDFYLSQCGFGEPLASSRQLPGETFCRHAISSEGALVIEDTRADPRYRDGPTVESLGVAAYLGIPLRLPNGLAIGAFCAINHEPRSWSETEVRDLEELAALAMDAIELRVERGRYRALVEGLDAIVWEMDANTWEFTHVSRCAEDMLGYPIERWLKEPGFWQNHLVHPDDQRWALPFCVNAAKEGRDHEFEYRAVAADGRVLWLHDRVRVVADEEGGSRLLRGIMVDITSQKQAAEALQDSEKKFRQIAENVQELFWIFSRDFSEAIYISPAYETLWGRSVESVYREPSSFVEAVHPEDLGALRTAMQQVGQDVFNGIEYRVIQPDETVRWMFSRGFPVRDEKGEVTRVVGTTADITERKQANEELQQSEDRFRTLFELSAAAILIHDDHGRILQVNQRVCDSLDYTRQELLRMEVTEIEVGADAEEMLAAWAQMHASAAQMISGVHRRKDGSTFPVEVWIRRISLEGEPLILAEAHDVGERREAEEKLAFAEAHYRRLVETAPQAIYALDAEGRFIELNPAGERLLERSAEDVMGQHFSTVITPADLGVATNGFERVISGEEYSIAFEERILRPSGDERLLYITETAIEEGGVITGTHGIAWDITEERADQEQIRLLATALENLEEGVSIARFDGELMYSNAAHARLLGYDLQLEGAPNVQNFLPDDEAKEQLQEAIRIAAERGTWTGRVRRRRIDDGSEIPLEMILGRVDSDEGEKLLVTIARDITEDIQKEQQLRRAERLAGVGTLIGGVAHELNNPLHAIRNFADLMLLDERSKDDCEALEIIRREADRATKVVSNLRLIARQSQEVDGVRESVDLNEVVRHVLKVRRYALETGNVQVREDLAENLPCVLADRSEIEQVVLNLVVNAEHAMASASGERRLILRTRSTPKGASLHLVDSGIGIPRPNLERIFDPFFTTKDPGEGTGLGLSLVHSIIIEHGGEIHVDSEIGGGTAFRIDLPRAPDLEQSAEAKSTPTPPSRPLRILVVDDEDAVRRVSLRYLERLGHRVDAVADGEEALRSLDRAEYDVILSDLRMPGLDGEELLRHLRQRGGGLERRLIFITGDAASGNAARIASEAKVPVLIKPIRLEELARAVEYISTWEAADKD